LTPPPHPPTLCTRIGGFWDATCQHNGCSELERAAQTLGMTALSAEVQEPGHFDTAFATMTAEMEGKS